MKRISFILTLFTGLIIGCTGSPVVYHNEFSSLPVWHPSYQTTYVEEYDAGAPEEDELEGVQCPIPLECRVKNYTGIQCVFSSLECLGRWGEIEELINPPLTSRSNCKSYSGPSDAAHKIAALGVRFENAYGDKNKALNLLKRAMSEGRGALMDIPGHAIVICHYDEKAQIVKIIDNSDRSLKIQTWSMDKFNKLWNGWIMVVYAKNDLFPTKARSGSLPNQIPIVDKNNPQGIYDKGYIPTPSP
jgi:hypothetical protein